MGGARYRGGGLITSGPSAAVFGGKLRLFVRGTDNGIYVNSFDGSTWSGWSQLPGGGKTPSGPAARPFNDHLFVFVRGTDDAIYVNRR